MNRTYLLALMLLGCTIPHSYSMQEAAAANTQRVALTAQDYEAMDDETCFRRLTQLRERHPRTHDHIVRQLSREKRMALSNVFNQALASFVGEAFHFQPETFQEEARSTASLLSFQQRISIGLDVITRLGSRYEPKTADEVEIELQQLERTEPGNARLYYEMIEQCPCYQHLRLKPTLSNQTKTLLDEIIVVGKAQKDFKRFTSLMFKLRNVNYVAHSNLMALYSEETACFMERYHNIDACIEIFIGQPSVCITRIVYNLHQDDIEAYDLVIKALYNIIPQIHSQLRKKRLLELDECFITIDQDRVNEQYERKGAARDFLEQLIAELELTDKKEKATWQPKKPLPGIQKLHHHGGKRLGQQPKRGR